MWNKTRVCFLEGGGEGSSGLGVIGRYGKRFSHGQLHMLFFAVFPSDGDVDGGEYVRDRVRGVFWSCAGDGG